MRVRRHIGRQTSRAWRHWAGAIFFPLLLVLLALAALARPLSEAALVAGAVCGAGLGVWGLKLTRYERTEQGFFYTPNAPLGIALSVLLVGRVLYRLAEVYAMQGHAAAVQSRDFVRSPLTLAIIGLLAGYYSTFAIGLLRWRRGAA
jgi:energy-converting hydrogenase Eha subunit A